MRESEIYEIFKEMNIVERYLKLCEKHQVPMKELFEKYNNKKVIEMIEEFGYNVKYYRSENFFRVYFEDYMDHRFYINLSLKYAIIDIIFVVRSKDEVLTGDPVSLIVKEVSDKELETFKPMFRDYDELNEILRETLELYEDFYNRVKSKLSA